ncbi:MAG TPA: hypothetical protein VHM19_02290, partial [Polyangiales bacterium]|nr:hypothetical protein [Polyangiales bacterium]
MSNRTILLCLLMLGLGSAAGAAAMRFGVLPRLLEHCHENAAQACPPASPAQPAAPTPPEPAAAQPPAPTVTPPSAAATATTLHRFLLCELGAGNPMLQPVDTRSQPQLWAVHCGTRVLLLGLDGSGADARPTRVATLTTRVPDPKLQLETAAILATDFAGSTRRDLLAAFSFRDAEGAPRGGSLFWLARNPSGGFSPPERLASAAARSLVRTRAGDLLIAHLEDPNLSHPSRLIAMHGGPSPVRAAALPLGVG